MDREMLRRHLEQAQRHVAQGERHIAEQELRINDLARLGQDTTEAHKLLDNFYASQVQHIQHRDRILRELAGPIPPPDPDRTDQIRQMVRKDIEEQHWLKQPGPLSFSPR